VLSIEQARCEENKRYIQFLLLLCIRLIGVAFGVFFQDLDFMFEKLI
jgi:hypothetical protein